MTIPVKAGKRQQLVKRNIDSIGMRQTVVVRVELDSGGHSKGGNSMMCHVHSNNNNNDNNNNNNHNNSDNNNAERIDYDDKQNDNCHSWDFRNKLCLGPVAPAALLNKRESNQQVMSTSAQQVREQGQGRGREWEWEWEQERQEQLRQQCKGGFMIQRQVVVRRPAQVAAGLVVQCYMACRLSALLLLPLLLLLLGPLGSSYRQVSCNVLAVDQATFIDPTCQWPSAMDETGETNEIIKLLLLLKCDLKPLIGTYERMLSSSSSSSNNGLLLASTGEMNSRYASLTQKVDHFYSEAIFILSRKDFCTYPLVERLSNLKGELEGQSLLMHVYDILAIEYHKTCLIDAITKLPQVPYIVKDVVEIYLGGADTSMLDLNSKPALFTEEGVNELEFNVHDAMEKNGELKDVVGLVLSIPSGAQTEQNFKDKCKEFLIEIDERWQTMEMMSRLLSTEVNGIQRFNNYVMRQLIPTKYADICSRLSRASR